METFDEAVFPRLSGRNKSRPHVLVLHSLGGIFAAIVGAEENGRSALFHDLIQKRDDVFGKNGSRDQDALALALSSFSVPELMSEFRQIIPTEGLI